MNPEFNTFCDQCFAALLALSPEVAGELGVREIGGIQIPQHRFSDISAAGVDARQQLMQSTLATLESFAPETLDDAQRISHAVFKAFLKTAHFGRLRGTDASTSIECDQLLNHLNGVQAEIITCLTEWHSFSDERSLQDYLARLDAIAPLLSDLRDELDVRVGHGQLVPACLIDRVRSEIASWLAIGVADCNLLQRLNESFDEVGCDAATAEAMRNTAVQLLETSVYPAYRELLDYLEGSYPHSENRIGLHRLPQGATYYRFLLQATTTTTLSAPEIHELGLAELAKLQQTITAELQEQGYKGDSFAQQLANFEADPAFEIPTTESREALLQRAEAILDAVRTPFLKTMGIKPRGEVVIKAIPEHQEGNRHSLYTPGNTDGGRPGIFYLNLSQLKGQSKHGLTTLTYHETFPGHHVQLTIAQELKGGVPEFRKMLTHDAYIEGWAKYSEVLPWLEGFNGDPCWNISRKRNELYSTANLVLDTGIHHLGWSREQGIEFFIDNTAAGHEFAEMIVDRIVATPGQVCSYKIGMMTVLAARARMETALGDKFDLPKFHDQLLRHGSIPLSLLDAQIDHAIAAATKI